MNPIRRWPRASRCSVARMPPVQLVAPIVGTSIVGHAGGVDDHHRNVEPAQLGVRPAGAGRRVTRMTPSVARARRFCSHCRVEVERRWIAETTVPTPAAWATSSTPRMISTAQGLSRSLKTRSISPALARGRAARRAVAVLAQQLLDPLPGLRRDVRAPVDHPRHGGHRHPGLARDRGDGDPASLVDRHLSSSSRPASALARRNLSAAPCAVNRPPASPESAILPHLQGLTASPGGPSVPNKLRKYSGSLSRSSPSDEPRRRAAEVEDSEPAPGNSEVR